MTAPARFGLAYDVLNHDVVLGDHAPSFFSDMERIESLGFDSVWFGETHRRKPGHGHAPSPLVVAAAVAARTERLQIGTAVLLQTTSTPLQLAEQVSLVDHLSQGRFILGVAPGLEVFRDFGFENFGLEPSDLQPLTSESLEVMRRLWTEPLVTHQGTYFSYKDAACQPAPYTRPHPSVLIGGITRSAIERAVTFGDGWVGGTPYPYDLIVKVWERYREAAEAKGRADVDATPFAQIRPIIVAETESEAASLAEQWVAPVIDYYLARGAYIRSTFKSAQEVTDEIRREALEQIPIVGTPDSCVEQIRRYQEHAGVNHFIFRIRFPNQADADRERMLELMSAELLPRLSELTNVSAR